MKKDVLVDAGVLISLTSSCLDNMLYFFAEKHKVRFIIPPSVEQEVVGRPLQSKIKRYLFSALRIQAAIDDGIIVVVDAEVKEKTAKLMKAANNLFYIKGKPLHLIDPGESEMLILAKELGVEYILIDERTTRMLIEAPLKLKDHLADEFKVNVIVNKKNFQYLTAEISALRALRTSELVMLSYENGYFLDFQSLQPAILEAVLYKIKYAGCSVGFREIKEYLNEVQ
ncbi:hypothetical protein JXA56_03025 [Candidatus Micrarchaeota archaeon]|nr:hypothetical protein [Candidatus Micrarchaeota archaeon]